jgi:hypothetical protein
VATAGYSAKEKTFVQRKNKRTHLTPTGLLMEGDSAQNPSMSDRDFSPTEARIPGKITHCTRFNVAYNGAHECH